VEIIIKTRAFIKKQILDIKTYGIRELLRKILLLIEVLVRIPIDTISIVPCLIIRLISPWIVIRIQKMPCTNFGDFLEYPATYYCKKELKIDQPRKKFLDLVYIHYKDKVYNRQIAKMWKRKFNFFSGYILDPISRVNKLIPGWKIHAISFIRERDIDHLFEKYQVLDFTTEEEIYGKKMLSKFGLKDEDKFVCLLVRDGAYQLKKISARYRDWHYHDYRHTDIDKFILAAEELAKRGYYIFRMGVIVEKPFNSKNPKIIDYANSNLRSDFMDIYLGAKCSFCISTGSGFQDLPRLFRKPVALMEIPLGSLYVHHEKFLLITKHHILKKEKRKLSLSEIFSHGVAYAENTEIFEQKGIELVDNTPDEIKDLAIEMVENFECKKKSNPEDEELQEIFRSLYAFNVKRFNCNDSMPKPADSNFASIINGQIKSRFSTKFLRENKNWLR
jgi:putative glycosyltransferase (TIGR04372 family)